MGEHPSAGIPQPLARRPGAHVTRQLSENGEALSQTLQDSAEGDGSGDRLTPLDSVTASTAAWKIALLVVYTLALAVGDVT
jgi:hypothetical protein